MNKIIAKRGRTKSCITLASSFADAITSATSLHTLEFRLNKLDESWREFVTLQNELLDFIESEKYIDHEPEYAEYEEKYFRTHAVITDAIFKLKEPVDNKVSHTNSNRESPSNAASAGALNPMQDIPEEQSEAPTRPLHNSIQLPKMTIEPFSGDYKDWPAFRDMFLGTIDSNNTISPVQKLHFLKSFLRGSAADLISHVKCSEANYVETWDRLERRYDQRHLIVKSFIESFISLPTCATGNVSALSKIADGAEEVVRGLNALDCNSRDPWLIHILYEKLDHETKKAWASCSRDEKTVDDFLDFLQARCRCLEACQPLGRSNQIRGRVSKLVHSHVVETRQVCPKCKGTHLLSQCLDFKGFSVAVRRDFARNSSLCFNCLKEGHSSRRCQSKSRCRLCNARHHVLVHLEENPNIPSSQSSSLLNSTANFSNHNSEQAAIVNLSVEPSHRTTSILPTAVARIKDRSGIYQQVRMLLDSGSQVSFITERIVQRLGLIRKRSCIPIMGIGSTSAGVTNGVVSLHLSSCYSSESIDIDCYVLPKLTSNLPRIISKHIPQALYRIELADPTYHKPGPIDILVGADKFFSLIKGASTRVQNSNLRSIPTIFGCVIAGRNLHPDSYEINSFCTTLDFAKEFDLERFWRLEEVSTEIPLSVEEELAEEIFVKNHIRRLDGRYEVVLPFKPSTKTDFGNSLSTAISRFHSVERRFKFNRDLKAQYSAFINEYISLGHMEEVPPHDLEVTGNIYYLPHHAIFKGDSTTTKIRVVFDASAKSDSGKSLNDTLLVGPTIQRDIFSICLRYRQHLYVVSGDIEKMYRQIWVAPHHADFQRIVWRENPEEPLRHYRLLTVTYGTSSAPFSAVRVLKQLAIDSAKTHPIASKILLNDFYVDDVITGTDNIKDLFTLQSELVNLLKSAGFNLRKWTTNCWPLLIKLPEDQRELSPVDFEDSNSVKILGLQWCPSRDCFSYKVRLSENSTCTKRRILSDASRLFDPLGFLAPVIVGVKVLFQELWRRKLKWDEEVPDDLALQWSIIRDELPILETLSIPRMMLNNKLNWELHGFCDASLDAYAAAVYCRSTSPDGTISVALVAAKSKVSPIKVLSLPRLELCGAVLLTRLINKIKLSLQEPDVKIFAWTDSAIVLHWLSAPPKKWSVFIANRTSEVLSSIHIKFWNHVRSASNPADIATRGISPSSLPSADLWWKGPPWLRKERSDWPVSFGCQEELNSEILEERKVSPAQVFVSNITISDAVDNLLNNSSCWIRSVRVIAYALRFLSNCRLTKPCRISNTLSPSEIDMAKTKLIKSAQMSIFRTEIQSLNQGKDLPAKNRLLSLSPFLDSFGVLRVGGRLEHSELSYAEKHPIILCKSHPISKLIAYHLHEKYLHPGVSLLFALINQNYFILGCRNLSRKIVHECVKCFRERVSTTKQLMADLPVERIRYARPFSKVGCDYAGPINLRLSRGRNPKFVKAYIALFICFVTKAIHVELVGDLSSVAFLLALDRFVARRGKPQEIWSDNGTNFRGAKRLLDDMHKLLCSQQHNNIVADHLANDGINWRFIPPSAPHFGGLWEAGVKSVKLHLKRVIGDTKLTYEEMYTLLVKIESLLNSRPMWKTSDSEPIALSPSHFLIGERYTAVPQPSVPNSIISMNINWSILQAMLQGFWSRWHSEYLTSLQQRPKWQKSQPNLCIDDVVLIKEPNLPPSKWIIGRITKLHPGSDSRIRVVTVKTNHGEFIRPAVKVSPLPFSERP